MKSLFISKKILGRRGENLAAEYLRKSGYVILASNVRIGRREIDLVAGSGGRTIFVEVKTRLKTAESIFEDPLTEKQTATLRRAITEYCLANRIKPARTRLDLIVILTDPEKKRADLRHYRDI